MSTELGIAVKATKQLNAILDAVGDLQKLETEAGKVKNSLDEMSKDEATKKLTSDIKRLSSEGSEELQKIRKAYEDVEQAGGKASKKQIDDLRQLIREYKAYSQQKMDPTQLFEEAAAKQLGARIAVGDLPPEQQRPLQELQSQIKRGAISRAQRAEVDVLESRLSGMGDQGGGGTPGGTQGGSDWGGRMRGVGRLFLGASLAGAALQAIHHWAEVDKQLVQVKQRFGDINTEVKNFGTFLGYTISESSEMSKIWGEISNKVNFQDMGQYVGFARYKGIEPDQAMQLRMAGRYVRQPEGAMELGNFERFSERMGMERGRINELIGSHTRLARMAAEQAVGLSTADVRGTQLFARELWRTVPGEQERGMGEWGAQYIQRLNQSMANPQSDAVRAFQMRAYGFGKGSTLSEVQERIQAGAFGKGNLQDIFRQLYAETPGMGKEERIQAMQPVFNQLGIKDIRPLMAAWEGPDRERIFKELEAGSSKSLEKDFETLGQSAISASDKFKVLTDTIRYETINTAIDSISAAIEGDLKRSIESLSKGLSGLDLSIKNILGLPKNIPTTPIDNFMYWGGKLYNWIDGDAKEKRTNAVKTQDGGW